MTFSQGANQMQAGVQGVTVEQMRAQVVALMQQAGIPIPPRPDADELRPHGPDAVHELMHVQQAQNMADTITRLSTSLVQARDALDAGDGNTELVEQIDQTLQIVSVTSLTMSKIVLDLQEIEQELRDDENQNFEVGGYL